MPRPPAYPTAAAALDALIAEHFAPQMKAAGFRKQRRSFASRQGGIIRILSFQGSQWSTSDDLGFYIKLGVWSDKVAAFRPYAEFGWDLPVKPNSPTWIPGERFWHWSADLTRFAKIAKPGAFRIDRGESRPQFVRALQKGVFEHAVPFLLKLDSEAALLKYIRSDHHDTTAPLFVAGLYRIAEPRRFAAYAREIMEVDGDPENERVWRLSLKRMGYRPTKP